LRICVSSKNRDARTTATDNYNRHTTTTTTNHNARHRTAAAADNYTGHTTTTTTTGHWKSFCHHLQQASPSIPSVQPTLPGRTLFSPTTSTAGKVPSCLTALVVLTSVDSTVAPTGCNMAEATTFPSAFYSTINPS
jgi:hypothetical protein